MVLRLRGPPLLRGAPPATEVSTTFGCSVREEAKNTGIPQTSGRLVEMVVVRGQGGMIRK